MSTDASFEYITVRNTVELLCIEAGTLSSNNSVSTLTQQTTHRSATAMTPQRDAL